jgi:hypothetical protein
MKESVRPWTNQNSMTIIVIVILVVAAAFTGCSEQKNQNSQSVSGIPGLQVSLEKNISVVRQYLRSDGSELYGASPFYYVTFVFTNTGDKPINLKDYLFVHSVFDAKTNTYFEPALAPNSFYLRPNLGPGASYRADPRVGVYQHTNCGGEAVKFRFEIKKSSETLTYPLPQWTTVYSMDYFIYGNDCKNLELYRNMGLDPAAYQKYIDDVKSGKAGF